MADLRNRGVTDILIACCDGLKGFEDAICAAFPHTVVQTCVVHLIRNALRPVARRDAAAVAAGLRTIYTAVDADTAFDAQAAFASSGPGQKYPQAVKVQENAWDRFTPFLAFTPPVRKLLYTTNSIVIPQLPAAESDQGPRALPRRRRRGQAAMAGDHQHRGQAGPRTRHTPARDRQTQRPARTPHRRTTRHGLARSTQRARRRLPGTDQVRAETCSNLKDLYRPEVTSSGQFFAIVV
jgi:hypothetical protein